MPCGMCGISHPFGSCCQQYGNGSAAMFTEPIFSQSSLTPPLSEFQKYHCDLDVSAGPIQTNGKARMLITYIITDDSGFTAMPPFIVVFVKESPSGAVLTQILSSPTGMLEYAAQDPGVHVMAVCGRARMDNKSWNVGLSDTISIRISGPVGSFVQGTSISGPYSIARYNEVPEGAPAPEPDPQPTPDPTPVPGDWTSDPSLVETIVSLSKAISANSDQIGVNTQAISDLEDAQIEQNNNLIALGNVVSDVWDTLGPLDARVNDLNERHEALNVSTQQQFTDVWGSIDDVWGSIDDIYTKLGEVPGNGGSWWDQLLAGLSGAGIGGLIVLALVFILLMRGKF